jgi:hypothetical protein
VRPWYIGIFNNLLVLIVDAKSCWHKFALSFRLSGEQKAQSCDKAVLDS